jgi:hypothetical protein
MILIPKQTNDTDKAGAFLNLYRVIGENTYGVQDTDTGRPTEQAEMVIAKRWLIASRESWPTISRAEMDAEVAKFLLSHKDWWDR